jgi:DNA-binding Xre family transcriptional regulator
LFFAACEARIEACRARGRKGSLQGWRDQALFKVAFGWGLRRAEVAMLDTVDFRPHPKLPEFGGYGQLHVRWGTAKRGGGPQRRTVLTVFDWAAEIVEQYVREIRPAFGCPRHPGLFLTERGTRISVQYVSERFAESRGRPGRHAHASLSATQLCHASGGARLGVEVHPGSGRAQPRRDHRDLHVGQRRLQRPDGPRRDRRPAAQDREELMAVDYEWRLRVLMAENGMFKAIDLAPRLAEHGIRLSDSQVWRLVTGRPERVNLRLMMVLCEILGCEPGELVKRTDVAAVADKEPARGGQIHSDLKPKQVRLKRPARGS